MPKMARVGSSGSQGTFIKAVILLVVFVVTFSISRSMMYRGLHGSEVAPGEETAEEQAETTTPASETKKEVSSKKPAQQKGCQPERKFDLDPYPVRGPIHWNSLNKV